MRKILFYLSMIFFLFSCDAQVAKSQFEKGQYVESVRTTLSYIGGNKINKLSEKDKADIISRVVYMDNYYKNNVRESVDAYDTKNMYDVFAINTMLNNIPELKKYTSYINDSRADLYMSKIEKNIVNSVNNSNKKELEIYTDIQKDMRKLNLLNSKYLSSYQKISKVLADKYIDLTYLNYKDEQKLELYKNAYMAYSDFDSNYRGTKTEYDRLYKKLDIQKAFNYFERGKSEYFDGDYDDAMEEFEDAYKIFSKYSDYYKEQREAKDYFERSKQKYNEKKAQKYYEQGLEYAQRGYYKEAVENFYKSSEYIYNYKNSLQLIKTYERFIPLKGGYEQKKNLTYNLNNSKRKNVISNVLDNAGLRYSSYNADLNIYYTEDVKYDRKVEVEKEQKYNGVVIEKEITEIVIITPYLSAGTYNYKLDEIILTNEYEEEEFVGAFGKVNRKGSLLGKDEIIRRNENKINREVEKLIRDFVRSL